MTGQSPDPHGQRSGPADDSGKRPAVTQFADPARSRAVLIGVSRYDSADLPDLPAVRNNVRDLRATLTGSAHPLCTDEHCTAVEEPRDLASVGRLLLQACAAAEDVLLFYYAGHGFLGGSQHELHLALSGTEPDDTVFTGLPYRLIREAFATTPARVRVVILDCCYAGRAQGLMTGGDFAGQVDIEGAYVLSAVPAYALAQAPAGEEHTLFTGEFLRVLREGIPGGRDPLTLTDIYQQLLKVMRRRGLPLPQQSMHQTAGLLAIAPNYAASIRTDAADSPGEGIAGGGGLEDWTRGAEAGRRITSAAAYSPAPASRPDSANRTDRSSSE